MSKPLYGSLLMVAVAFCGCTGAGSGAGAAAQTSTGQTQGPLAIRQILLGGESGTLNAGQPPKPVTPQTTVVATVALNAAAREPQPLSLRLIDVSNGKTVGEQHSVIAAGVESARFEFKPAQSWTSGRHLLEARLGQAGKVFQREFDVVPETAGGHSAPGA
ncbi:hypothetical protein [Xanthomonas albilineans]|uniref:hypothetical protein n=1 Tax=Xanthomonas albilineans TaxID=29447 RepID=UPI0005F334CF|nr:hypothetical protein [Xanthomonas albilineans]